jgi:predicted RNase H-like nuclease
MVDDPPANGPLALGLDAAGAGRDRTMRWCGVVLDGRGFVAARTGSLVGLVAWADSLRDRPVGAVGVDIPIGHVGGRHRKADVETRAFVRPLGSTVFPGPPAEVLGVASYAEANEVLTAMGLPKMSKQAWMLVPRIVEATELARVDERLHEVHPEASFREMKIQLALAEAPGADVGSIRITRSKKTWNGLLERRALLAHHGVVLPEGDPALDGVVADDVVDAAAAAWTARRIALRTARSMPEVPEASPDGRAVAVWR